MPGDVTRVLSAIGRGDPDAAAQLLPLVYDELRRLAARRLARESPGQTLQATALVHEAYIKLVGQTTDREWNGRGHFFTVAAEAMRRILVDKARRRNSQKQGGGRRRNTSDPDVLPAGQTPDVAEVLAIHDVLDQLAEKSPRKAELVKLRYFLGCTIPEAAELLGIAPATAEEDWTFAKAWLRRRLDPADDDEK